MRQTIRSTSERDGQKIGSHYSRILSAAISADYFVTSTDDMHLFEHYANGTRVRHIDQSEESEIAIYDLRTFSYTAYPINAAIRGIVDDYIIGVSGTHAVRINVSNGKVTVRTSTSDLITGVSDNWYTIVDGSFVGPDTVMHTASKIGVCDVIDVGDGAIILATESQDLFMVGRTVTVIDKPISEHRLCKGRSEIFCYDGASIAKLHLGASRTMWEDMLEDRVYDSVAMLDDNIAIIRSRARLYAHDMRSKTARRIHCKPGITKVYAAENRIVTYHGNSVRYEFMLLI